jgi:hypothetical protein
VLEFTKPHGWRSAFFANLASATFTRNALDTQCCLLLISLECSVFAPQMALVLGISLVSLIFHSLFCIDFHGPGLPAKCVG